MYTFRFRNGRLYELFYTTHTMENTYAIHLIVFALVLIVMVHNPVVSQNAVKGTVRDDQGKPISHVVTLIGTSLRYTTQDDGKFSLSPSKIHTNFSS